MPCYKSPDFFRLLVRIDAELAGEARAGGCLCGGVLHRADYPRKPRACPMAHRAEFATRFSFCCSRCRRRTTSVSVRFLGRRVYLGLAVVLVSTRAVGQISAAAHVGSALEVPVRTLQRWRQWWREQFALTPLWQAMCARFMPPVVTSLFPASLLERFAGTAEESLRRLLEFLSPLTVITFRLREGR
jgi:hypothetical protein